MVFWPPPPACAGLTSPLPVPQAWLQVVVSPLFPHCSVPRDISMWSDTSNFLRNEKLKHPPVWQCQQERGNHWPSSCPDGSSDFAFNELARAFCSRKPGQVPEFLDAKRCSLFPPRSPYRCVAKTADRDRTPHGCGTAHDDTSENLPERGARTRVSDLPLECC